MTTNPYEPPSTDSQARAEPPIHWRGSVLEVQARLVSRFVWTTASIDVYLDGSLILRSGGAFRVTGSCDSEFTRDGLSHKCELQWGAGRWARFPFTLSIDGEQIVNSTVRITNWPMLLIPSLIISLFLLCLLLGVDYLLRALL